MDLGIQNLGRSIIVDSVFPEHAHPVTKGLSIPDTSGWMFWQFSQRRVWTCVPEISKFASTSLIDKTLKGNHGRPLIPIAFYLEFSFLQTFSDIGGLGEKIIHIQFPLFQIDKWKAQATFSFLFCHFCLFLLWRQEGGDKFSPSWQFFWIF